MLPHRLRRLSRCTYLGPRLYFLTLLTKARRRVFLDATIVAQCREQFLRAATLTDFAIRAYTYMPDHLHMLVEGLAHDADLRAFMKRGKQLSAYHTKRVTGSQLWVNGYLEWILRHDEDPQRFVRYILLNPVRAGLSDAPGQHPHTWIDTPSKPDL
jgi:putative transposase